MTVRHLETWAVDVGHRYIVQQNINENKAVFLSHKYDPRERLKQYSSVVAIFNIKLKKP